jgi:hypothetical protein
MGRDRVVGIVTGYWLDDQGVGVRVPVGYKIFTSPIVETGSEVYPISNLLGMRDFFHEG